MIMAITRTAARAALTEMIHERQKLKLQQKAAEQLVRSSIRSEQRKAAVRRAKRRHTFEMKRRERAFAAKQKRVEQLLAQRVHTEKLLKAARHEAYMTNAVLRDKVLTVQRKDPEEALRFVTEARQQLELQLVQHHTAEADSETAEHQDQEPPSEELGSEFSSILSISSLPRGNTAVEQLKGLQTSLSNRHKAMAAAVRKSSQPARHPSSHGSTATADTSQLLSDASQVGVHAGISWALESASTAQLLASDNPSGTGSVNWKQNPAGAANPEGVSQATHPQSIPPKSTVTRLIQSQQAVVAKRAWLKMPDMSSVTEAPAAPRTDTIREGLALPISNRDKDGKMHHSVPIAPSETELRRIQAEPGYNDDEGVWHAYADEGFYNDEGTWEYFDGYYDEKGLWCAYEDEVGDASDGKEGAAAGAVEGLPSVAPTAESSVDSMVTTTTRSEGELERLDAEQQEMLDIREKILNTRSTLTSNESDWEGQSYPSTEIGKHQQRQVYSQTSLGEDSTLFAQAYTVGAYRGEPVA
jgi:hypothetical protein